MRQYWRGEGGDAMEARELWSLCGADGSRVVENVGFTTGWRGDVSDVMSPETPRLRVMEECRLPEHGESPDYY